jgi:carboxyl-terminal processing protease
MQRSRKIALVGVLMLPVVAGGFLLQGRVQRQGELLLDQVMSLVSDRFVDTLPSNDVYEKAARGLVKELNDPYSELLTPKDLKQFDSRTGGRYGGLGMLIQPKQGGGVEVVTVYPNTPAERAGIREGDRIIKADTLSTLDWNTTQVSDYLTGTPGTRVSATFARPGVGTPITATFVREIIKVPAIPYTLVLGNKVGYVPLAAFNENAADNLDTTLKRMQRQGVKGVVLDMRGNPGGILDQSLNIAKMFLKNGQEIAAVKGRSGTMDDYKADGMAVAPNLPLIVLTDERTASPPRLSPAHSRITTARSCSDRPASVRAWCRPCTSWTEAMP